MLALNSLSTSPCSFSYTSSSSRKTIVQFISLIVCCYAPGSHPTGAVLSNTVAFQGTSGVDLLVLTFMVQNKLVQKLLGNHLGLMKAHLLTWSQKHEGRGWWIIFWIPPGCCGMVLLPSYTGELSREECLCKTTVLRRDVINLDMVQKCFDVWNMLVTFYFGQIPPPLPHESCFTRRM